MYSIMKLAHASWRSLIVALGLIAGTSVPSFALHLNTVAPIDVIDGIFGPSGGTIMEHLDAPPGRIGGSGETDWFVFSANSGDPIKIFTEGMTDTIIAVFLDMSGTVMVGDDPKCTTGILFDCFLDDPGKGQLAGYDLERISMLGFDDDSGPSPFNAMLNFVAATTGMYVIAVQENSKNDPGDYSITLEFNLPPVDTGNGNSIVEPGVFTVFGLGLAAIGYARRRRIAAQPRR